MASKPLSNRNSIPRRRKKRPNPDKPIPISKKKILFKNELIKNTDNFI